jgi:hypothetical protein
LINCISLICSKLEILCCSFQIYRGTLTILQTILLSPIYGVTMPCSHQSSLDIAKSSGPHPFNCFVQNTWPILGPYRLC